MNESQKYCRSLHAQISLGTTSDDRFMPNGYVKAFADMDKLVLTEKLDGQNNCFNKFGVFARSHTAPTVHPWDKPMLDRWQLIKNDLNDLEIFGENMYGIHSIEYSKLESFYYVFAVRENGIWLSWDEVKFYAELLDFPTVPEIEIKVPLKDFYRDDKDENKLLQEWFKANLGLYWEESVETPGLLGGMDPATGKPCSEGFVVRNSASYKTNDGVLKVADNEFNNLFKLVRGKHVKTDVHWTKTWRPATLMNYEKHKWYGYEFSNRKSDLKSNVQDVRQKDLGKIVKYAGEYGVIILAPSHITFDSIVVRWDTSKEDDYESYNQLEYEFVESYQFKNINSDGTLK